jgi:hypothetical protein
VIVCVACDEAPQPSGAASAPPATTAAAGTGAPSADGAAPRGATATSAPTATGSVDAGASAKPKPPGARCSAAAGKETVFLGRIMGFHGAIIDVDRLGMLVRGSDDPYERHRYAHPLRRVAKDTPAEVKLEQAPVNQLLVKDAAEYFLTEESIYYLEPQRSFPFNSRLLRLPTGEEPGPEPQVLANEAQHILGEWDGWLYVLRLRPEIDGEGLSPKEIQAIRSEPSYLVEDLGLVAGFWMRFRYDLMRVRQDGTSEVIAEVPRAVDDYFDGYVYGRDYDRKTGELSVFRLPVKPGPREIIFRRPRARCARGGLSDNIGRAAVDRDGVFFADGKEGVVRKLAHAGGTPDVVKRDLAFYNDVSVMQDYLFVWGAPFLKNGTKPTWSNEHERLFGKGESGCCDKWSSVRKGNFEFVMGRASDDRLSCEEPSGFAYEYLPGGIIHARRFALRSQHAWMGELGVDEQCLYYTRTDGANTWFYSLPRPPTQ